MEYPWEGYVTSGSIMEWKCGTPQKEHVTSESIEGWRLGTPLGRPCDQWKYYGMEMGYTPWCEAIQNITIPHTSDEGGNNRVEDSIFLQNQ